MENINLTPIIVALIGVLGTVITTVLIPWLKSKTTKQQWDTVTAWTVTAVQAVEVICKGAGKGAEKKQAVLDYINKKCEENNIELDPASIDFAIEQAWADMTGAFREDKD